MSITRTAWTDDDGTGTTGTIINNAEKTALYDQIDSRWTIFASTSTGSQNNFSITSGGVEGDVLRWNGASAITLTGIVAPASPAKPGKPLIIENITAGQTLKVSHNSGSSSAANRILCQSTQGQIIGPGGRLQLVYDSTSTSWRCACLDPGAPITPTFAAGDYTANGAQTWTVASGDVATFAYQQRGKMVTFFFSINTSTVGGTPNTDLLISMQGFTATKQMNTAIGVVNNGTAGNGHAQINASGTTIRLLIGTQGNWAAATDTTGVYGQITAEVN